VTASSGLSGDSRSYQYDHDENRVEMIENDVTSSYVFDRTGALSSAVVSGGPPSNPATYDAFGNLTGVLDLFGAVPSGVAAQLAPGLATE
jgi:hypothetical protein